MNRWHGWIGCCFVLCLVATAAQPARAADHLRKLQTDAVLQQPATWGHWGPDTGTYSNWTSHTNRLVPIYTFGLSLDSVTGKHSVYRDEQRLQQLYGRLPEGTLNPEAEYCDQTDVYRLQALAAESGKKYIILMVFDGMDWEISRAAAIYRSGKVFHEGRGSGLTFLDYHGAPTSFGFMVTSPHDKAINALIDTQTLKNSASADFGGYDARMGGATPWAAPADPTYLTGESKINRHAVTDSAAAATSMTTGIKTYNDSVNVDSHGSQVATIAHQLQQRGFAIGVVTSVQVSHATPACAYAHNVHRDDYQDLTRDLLGLPSIAHPDQPLKGVDVLLGAGWGEEKSSDSNQGNNFVPGNRYVAEEDLRKCDTRHGGGYVVAMRTAGKSGREVLVEAAIKAVHSKHRLFGLFGCKGGHLPFATADGKYDPTFDAGKRGQPGPVEEYTSADVQENPTLADMTAVALDVLAHRSDRFWLMIEAGDVDWAAHSNNLDNTVGAVISGDEAFRAVTKWVEKRGAWDDTAVIVTADHGHYLVLDNPEALIPPQE